MIKKIVILLNIVFCVPLIRAQETYLMASIANDEAIIDELTNGSGDIHSLTAYMAYQEIPRDTPIKDIKKLYHNLRQDAKRY